MVLLQLGAQHCSQLNLQHQSDIPSLCVSMTMTMMHDALDRPYLYVAEKEGGLRIHNISDLTSPVEVANVPITNLSSLHVMNLSQSGNYLYLAIGSHFLAGQPTGFAIVDVTDPTSPFVTDHWVHQGPDGGGGIVKVEGNYAYLGAMRNGLIIFDVTDKNNIDSVSQFIPDLSYPEPNPDTPKYNLRGLVVTNNIAYTVFDAGGVRIINCTDKQNPIETGRYSNPLLNGAPRAYNNIILDDTLLYVTFDYCGLEILSVADTSDIYQVSWWNPWTCETNPFNWFTSLGHTNEIFYDKDCGLVFMSTGKSDMYVVDVSDPSAPDSCNVFGNITDSLGTWGISAHKGKLFLSYICVPWPYVPFPGLWTGVKVLTYEQCATGIDSKGEVTPVAWPNPTGNHLNVFLDQPSWIEVCDLSGRILFANQYYQGNAVIDVSAFPGGSYLISMKNKQGWRTEQFIKASR